MDPLSLAISLRAVERLLVVIAGAISIYLGYKLFLAMPKRDASSGKVELPGGISIYLSRVGPGAFFSLFGSIVIALSLHYGIQFSDQITGNAAAPAKTGPEQMAQGGTTQRTYSSLAATTDAATGTVHEAERTNAVLAVEALNRIDGSMGGDLSSHDRIAMDNAILAGKLSLMRSVWDEANWGPWSDFKVWVNEGEADPAPPTIKTAARLFRAGSPTGEQ